MNEIYAFFDQHREEIKKDFIDSALEYALWTGGRSDWGNSPSSSDLEKNRNMLPGQTNLVRINYKSFVKEIMNRYTTLLYGKSSSPLVDNLFNAIEEELPGNSYSKPAIFQDALHEWLEKNIDMSNIGSIMEGAYNYATQKTHEIESPSDPKILLEQYKKEFKVSKWKKVSASPELIQKMQNQFYDPEQIIVANYVQQSGKSITVNPRNLEYWEKAEIVSDLMQDRKLVSNLFDEAETFAHSFIKKYNLNDAEIIKEKFIELIEEEINEVRDRYLNDIYNQIYQDAERVGKDIAGYFMDNDPGDVERWPVKARLDEIKNLEEGQSALSDYAHSFGFDEVYSFQNVAVELEQADLDPGYEAWHEGLEEGFYSSINVRKIEDLLGTDTSYLYEPIDPSREEYLGPEQTDENEAKKHRREIADKWKIEYDKSKRDRLNWATEEDFPKKPWDFTSGFKKKADLSPELIDLAKQMAKDIVPHPLDYMREQEEQYGRDYIPEVRSIILALNSNWLRAMDLVYASVEEAMWYNLNDEIQNPYLDEDLKQEIEENIDEFSDKVWEQTGPVLNELWTETEDVYINEISETYDGIIFEEVDRLLSDINDYWNSAADGEDARPDSIVNNSVIKVLSGEMEALEFIGTLTVDAERELEWLHNLHDSTFSQVRANAHKSANEYIQGKMPDLIQYINTETNQAVNQMYEPVDSLQEPYLGPEETDENEARKHRKKIKDKWKIEPNKPLEWATEEDFPKKRWESSTKFKKFANLSPELVELAKEMAQDIVPHPLDYMRAQEEYLGSEYISEYRSIVVALEKNWSYAIETASESINDAMWHNLHYEINENPYLDEDLKQDIEDNIDYFMDEVREQTEPILDILWQETVNQYIQDISNTYDDIIFEAFNRLNEDIRDFWGGDNETINVFVNSLISGEIDALSFLDKLTVYAEQEIDWLQNLSPSLIEPIKENARKSADKYIEEKISDLIDYIGETVPNTKIQEMYEPVDSSQEAYLGPDETDENEAKKHRKQIKDKWKIQPNQPLQWATEEEFPKKPWDFKSKVAAPNQFLPRLYHTMIENLKRTAAFNWESESNIWNKVQVAYEILNDWHGYVEEIQEESGYQGPEYILDPLMRDAFIDIFKPIFESFMYVDDDELHSQFETMHNNVRQNAYGTSPYVIDNALYKAYTETGYYLDRQEHPKWSPSQIVDFYKDEPPESEKDYEDLRKNEILDKWKPEDWWKGSKWKKVSADEHDEEEEEVEPEIRTWWEVDGDVDEGFRRIDLYDLARSYVEQYSWPDEVWSHVLPRNVFDDEEKFVEFVDGLKYTDASRLASDWIEQHHGEIIDYLVDSIYQEYDYSVFTDEEFNQYQSEIDERVSEMVYDYAYEAVNNAVSIVEKEFEDELYDIQESVFEKYREYLEEKDRRIHPDQEMMDVFDVKGELPPPPQEESPPWLTSWMRQQSKVSNNGDWSQETEILIDYILKDNRIINPTIDVMEKIVQQGGSPEELANWTIENVLNEYNDQIAQQWEQVSDEEDIEDQKQQLRRTWKQQARKQFPFSLKKQKQYVQEMEQMQFGLFGEPEPEKIEKYLLKVENIDWQGIYDWIKEDLQYRRKMASSSEEEQYQKIKESEIIQDVFDKLYTAGVGQANREIPQLIKTQTGREPYEYMYHSPSGLDNLPRPDRLYDEDQLSIFREQFSSDKETLEKKAFDSAKKEFEPIVAGLSALLTVKIDWERVYQDGAEYWIQGYWDGIRGLYKNNLEIARAKRKDPEGWRQSKWKVISNQRQYEIDWSRLFEEKTSSHGQNQMAIGDEVAETTFEGVEVDPDPEPEEKIINGKKWKMVRPKPNKQPAEYARPKGGWGFYSKHKKSDLDNWTDNTKLAIEKIINDLPNRIKIRAVLNADNTVRDWIQRSLKEKLESTKWYNPYYNFDKKRWEDGEGQEILLNPYEERMTPFHNSEKNRLIHKNQTNLGLEQVRNMADIALWRYDRFDQILYRELGQLILDTFPGIKYRIDEQKSIEKDIYKIINERELESIYNDAYYKAWEKAFNEEVSEEEKSLINKSSKKDAWEAVLDGELGHDILTTGTWEEVKKQTIKWLKQFKDGFLNKKNPHDNKKIDADAKEQDVHAIEDLKLYDEEKRWSFHFDHGKHPYDLIIQPVGYKESKWIKSKLSEDLIIEEKIG